MSRFPRTLEPTKTARTPHPARTIRRAVERCILEHLESRQLLSAVATAQSPFTGKPIDVFLGRMGLDRSVLEGSDSFRLRALECPLGVATRSGEEIRVIQGLDPSDGSVLCSAGIPQGGLAWVMEGDIESLVAGATTSCQDAVRTLGDATPLGLLTFDCAVRRRELGPAGVYREIAEIGRAFPGVPFGGFYSYGEIARFRGATGMHHLTMVSLAIA